MEKQIFKKISIIGLGLIGGSLAKALHKSGFCDNIYALSHQDEDIKKAYDLGIIRNKNNSTEDVIKGADLIVLCCPLGKYEQVLKEIKPFIEDGCLITDVGSVKYCTLGIVSSVLGEDKLKSFIPAHPIAGSEKSGFDASYDSLYQERKTILTPTPVNNEQDIDKIEELWKACGSAIEISGAEEHDEIYAQISHLPQFLAFCYLNALMKVEGDVFKHDFFISDKGFRKFFRLAYSSPYIWGDIFYFNKRNILACSKKIKERLIIEKQQIKENSKSFLEDVSYSKENTVPPHIIATIEILSVLLALLALEISKNTECAGTGFKDFTFCAHNVPHNFYQMLYRHHDSTTDSIDNMILEIDNLSSLIKRGTPDDIVKELSKSSDKLKNLAV